MEYLKLHPTTSNTFILLEAYKGVPAGYETNGADIPRFLWSLIPPNNPKYLSAVVLHDYWCDEKEFKKADELFKDELLGIENSWKTRAMVWSVEVYHQIRYGVK